MRIILDNRDEEEFNRIVMIQQKTNCIGDLICMFMDTLKAMGFSDEVIDETIQKMDEEDDLSL